jgi:dynein heavy chain 2
MISSGSVGRCQTLFALAWFHAIIQERRNYIPQGWNKFYEFSAADLRSSASIILQIFASGDYFQWEIIHGLLSEAIYGSKVDDHQDALKLQTYLVSFFNSDVLSLDGKSAVKKLTKAFGKFLIEFSNSSVK